MNNYSLIILNYIYMLYFKNKLKEKNLLYINLQLYEVTNIFNINNIHSSLNRFI